jgi:polysaccharide transporter, PST family
MRQLISLIKKTYHMAGPQEGKVVLHNVASLSGLQAITYILPLIILPFLFRTIGPEKFGLLAFAQAFVQYFMILTDYGFSITATKEISLCFEDKRKVNQVFSEVMSVKTVLAIISLVVLTAIVWCIPKFGKDWEVYVLSFGVVAGNTIFPVWFFQGSERMKYIAKLNIIGEFVYAFCIFMFIQGPQDFIRVPIISSVVSLATGILGQYILATRFGVSFQLPSYQALMAQLKSGWDIFISVVAINAYTTTRVFAVGLMTTNTMTGYYSIAEKIANVAQTFPLSSFSQALFPRLSKIFQKNKAQAFKIMSQIQLITIIISLICLPIIALFAPEIVQIVCGKNYPEVVLSLRLLLLSVFFISSNAFRVQFLLVCGKTKTYSKIHVTMAFIGLPLILFLIYSWSYVGAAMSTVFIEAGIFTVTFFTVRKLTF